VCRYVKKFNELGMKVQEHEIISAASLAAAYLASEGIGLATGTLATQANHSSKPSGRATHSHINDNLYGEGDQVAAVGTGSVLVFGMEGLLEELQLEV
jgi:hypothetical protein